MDRITEDLCETHTLGPHTGEWLVMARQVPAFAFTTTRVAGFSDAREGYRFVRHAPAFSQILACTAGMGRVLVDGRWENCTAGTVYLTAPRTLCAYHVPPRGRWQVCWVLFEESVELPTLEPGRAPRLVRADARGLHLAIEGLCHEADGEAEPAALEVGAAIVHRYAMRILEPGPAEPRLAQLWRTVRRELGGEWTLERMARCAGISEESLRRLCQRHLGRPPLAHLTHLRMRFAADLLGSSDEKIASIAARVGYGDAFAFSNAFKRELGVPPSRLRPSK